MRTEGENIFLPIKTISRFFMVAIMLLLTSLQTNAQEKETKMYVAYSNNTATFYYDNLYGDRQNEETEVWDINLLNDFWFDKRKNFVKVIFDSSFANARPTSTRRWFYDCKALNEVIGIENLNTENVTDMLGMFYGCASLTSLDVSNFNTSNVTDMSSMFYDCLKLTSLNVSKFNTSKVTKMNCMFSDCLELASLDVSKFNTSNVTEMHSMFMNCTRLTRLDVSNFNTSKVEQMWQMFHGCYSLTNLDVSKFDTGNVVNLNGMFQHCINLINLDVSNFNTCNVIEMAAMFNGCEKLTSLDVSHFDTRNVTDMFIMFQGCRILTDLDLTNFDTSNVTDMKDMFKNCSSLESISIGKKITQMPSFQSCSKIKRIVSHQTEPYAINSECFSNKVKENAKLYVPNNTRTIYTNTDGWKEFKHIASKDLDPEDDNFGMGKDNMDENTDLYGNIVNNVYFNISEGAGKYIEADGCVVLNQATTDEQMNRIIGLDLFDEQLLKNFTGMIFMVDAGSGTIELEAETVGEMQLSVMVGTAEPITKQVSGKSKVSIPYDVAEPTLVYVYGSMPAAQSAKGIHKANAAENALKIYSMAWGKATGIRSAHSENSSEAIIYNLNGQRVKTPGKGLYIVNGKKVILK